MKNMVLMTSFFRKSAHKPLCLSVSALKFQCNATVKEQQSYLQLYLLEPRRTSYEIPRYLISYNDNLS